MTAATAVAIMAVFSFIAIWTTIMVVIADHTK